ncbi:MAG TPA: BPSS1780 family membrane protein [Burkholderiales bacterium]|nr:BPSS1780 family membrane protein [Burkholderiales bacterium]
MSVNIRSVAAMRGWDWLVEGAAIFGKASAMWVALLAVLFVGSRLMMMAPVISVIMVLVTPNFIAGLAHGAQALGQGKPLRLGYLASGFLRNAVPLIVVGVLSLAGQVLILLLMAQIGGDAFNSILDAMSSGAPPGDAAQQTVREVAPNVILAALTGFALLMLLMMTTAFASLLVFFDGIRALPAFGLSLRACAKNLLPLLLYGVTLLTPVLAMMPLTVAIGQPDLGLWLVSPLLTTSLYACYRDIFVPPAAD